MAQHTRHPVAAPPVPPVREATGQLMLRAYCVLVLFTAMCGTFWYNLSGAVGMISMIVVLAGASIAIWVPRIVRRRTVDPFPWRRLPWVALGYTVWALASLAWSGWPATTALTWGLLALTTLQGLFVANVLTWRELVRTLELALKWIVGGSLAFELFVTVFVRGPLLPNLITPVMGEGSELDPQWYWSRDNLIGTGRIQGLAGNANLLAITCLLAILAFALRYASKPPLRSMLLVWIVAAAYLMFRAASVTAYVCAVAVAAVVVAALLIRRTSRPGQRTRRYALFAGVAVLGVAAVWLLRETLLGVAGRDADLTGREHIWEQVLERAASHPVIGSGFASPWIPWDPAFDRWIVDHDMTVLQAHNMWVDVFFQLGWIGIALMGILYLAYLWRSWFFAVDRPRWDLRADRPYSPLTLLPISTAALLLVQGLTESGPIMLWGWMLVVMLGFKIKSSPHIGVGFAERDTLAAPRERTPRRAP